MSPSQGTTTARSRQLAEHPESSLQLTFSSDIGESHNEGRGISPGETERGVGSATLDIVAQRRPGYEPRRNRRGRWTVSYGCPAAQRRPGYEPRRNLEALGAALTVLQAHNEGRGMSPGETRVRRSGPSAVPAHNEGRGMSPGETPLPAIQPTRLDARTTKAGV